MRHKRKYAAFERIDGKWQRVSPGSLPLDRARIVWQDWLLGNALAGKNVALRPVPPDKEVTR